ncbi:MAG: helix-turn-helix transcriptional regulator [Oscillospiraceae bacterium]|nr:helix-turn-helix transcriptional regulator [Oscillospiraceae bacterium]
MDIIGKLKKLQSEYGWSDYRIAKESGLSSETVSNIYKRNTIPNFYTLNAICNGFGITLAQFFRRKRYG